MNVKILGIVIFTLLAVPAQALAATCQTYVNVLTTPDSLAAGGSVRIYGTVSPIPIDPPVNIYVDDIPITTVNTDYYGNFNYNYQTPSSMAPGVHVVKAVSTTPGCTEGYFYTIFTITSSQVCSAGATRNRQCACPTQIGYEICKSDGSGWETVVEVCPSGQACENGQCVTSCTDNWTNNYRCSGNSLQRQFQYSDCSTSWLDWQYCSAGCSNNQCNAQPSCSAGFQDQYRCSGAWRQRLYQNSDCSTEWRDWNYCSYGCSGNSCMSTTTTTTTVPCTTTSTTTTMPSCYSSCGSCGCTNCGCASCDGCQPCDLHVSVNAPVDALQGETVTATINVENFGDQSGYINLNAYICRSDGSNCIRMDCHGGSSLYVAGDDSSSFTCSIQANELSSHKIKVDYTGCDGGATVYSNNFEVKCARCTETYLNEYTCMNNWKMRKYQQRDCTNVWKQYEYCQYGCAGDKCADASIIPTKEGAPLVMIKDEINVLSCELSNFSFIVKNVGQGTGTFELNGSGDLAKYAYMQPTVTLLPGEQKAIDVETAFPCDIEGDRSFTVTASGKTDAFGATKLRITSTKAEEQFALPSWFWTAVIYLLIALLVILLLLALLFFLLRRPRKAKVCCGKKNGWSFGRRSRAEHINGGC